MIHGHTPGSLRLDRDNSRGFTFFFFFKFLLDRGPFCGLTGTLCFGLRMTLSMSFKVRVDWSSPAHLLLLTCNDPQSSLVSGNGHWTRIARPWGEQDTIASPDLTTDISLCILLASEPIWRHVNTVCCSFSVDYEQLFNMLRQFLIQTKPLFHRNILLNPRHPEE